MLSGEEMCDSVVQILDHMDRTGVRVSEAETLLAVRTVGSNVGSILSPNVSGTRLPFSSRTVPNPKS